MSLFLVNFTKKLNMIFLFKRVEFFMKFLLLAKNLLEIRDHHFCHILQISFEKNLTLEKRIFREIHIFSNFNEKIPIFSVILRFPIILRVPSYPAIFSKIVRRITESI